MDPTGGPDSVAKSLIEETVETTNDSGYTENIAKAVTASMYLGEFMQSQSRISPD